MDKTILKQAIDLWKALMLLRSLGSVTPGNSDLAHQLRYAEESLGQQMTGLLDTADPKCVDFVSSGHSAGVLKMHEDLDMTVLVRHATQVEVLTRKDIVRLGKPGNEDDRDQVLKRLHYFVYAFTRSYSPTSVPRQHPDQAATTVGMASVVKRLAGNTDWRPLLRTFGLSPKDVKELAPLLLRRFGTGQDKALIDADWKLLTTRAREVAKNRAREEQTILRTLRKLGPDLLAVLRARPQLLKQA